MQNKEAPAEHKFLKLILTAKAFAAIRTETRQWLIECQCGFKRDFWDAGGIRYKAVGEPRQLTLCPVCKKGRWHKVRRKTEEELTEETAP